MPLPAVPPSARYATVRPEPPGYERRTRHTWGLPPDDRLMPWPAVLIIEQSATDAMLYRYAADGTFAGDTWHESTPDAEAQAEFEYGELLSDWLAIPDGEDITAYALSRVGTSDAN